jgi:protein tyrosine phosphatase (PTP) superfamily phosphohydrolase (DUF442 family)
MRLRTTGCLLLSFTLFASRAVGAEVPAPPVPKPAGLAAEAEARVEPRAPRFARRLPDARGVAYAAEVAPGLYRGGQPSAEGVAWLKSKGFKTVLNLRHYHGDSEKQLVESVGMRYERIALTSWGAPAPDQIARFLEIVRDPTLRPLYVHCQHGVDRTGAMMAVYRMEEEGWSNPEAYAEMLYFDAHRIWQDLRDFVRRYRVQPRPARFETPR